MRQLVLALALAGLALPAAAQGSRTADTPNFSTYRSIDGVIEYLDAREGVLVVREKHSEELVKFAADAKIKLKADKKTELSALDQLGLADFRVGHSVRLTFRTRDGYATELRLRYVKPKKK